MAIDWDEIRRKGQEKGAAAEAQVQFKRAVPSLPVAPPKPLPRIPTAVQSRRGNLPQAKPSNVLAEAFDREENYIDKAKRGDIGGAAANFAGTGLTAAQSIYLNIINNADSLTRGRGLAPFKYQMSFADYDKAVAERRGAKPTIEQASDINPYLGQAYQFVGEVGTDPLELTPLGFANDIKLAKGLNQGSQAYTSALQSGKLNPLGTTATLPRATTPAPQPRTIPFVAKNAPVENIKAQPDMPARAAESTVQPRNSKVVSLYHGGTVEPSKFDISKASDEAEFGKGFYASDGKGIAEEWAKERGGKIHQTKVDTTNFFDEYNADLSDPRYTKVKQLLVGSGLSPKFVEANFGGQGTLDYMAKALGRNTGNTMFSGSKKISEILKRSGFDGAIAEFRDTKQYVSYDAKNIMGDKPQPLPQAPTKPVQPSLPKKGTGIPKEQPFAKTEDLRNNFSQAHGEKFEADYNNFMKETEDLPDVQTGASEFAQRITSKGVSRGKDIQRIADSALRHSKEAREWFKRTVEDPLYVSKGKYATETKTKLDKLHKEVVTDLGIKKASKESAGVQWYGEGKKQRTSGKNKSTETVPYTIDDLKADFNYTMPNGKKAWENIVQAEGKIRVEYMRYVDKINEALRKIYPNVEANVEKLQAKLAKTIDPEARKAVLQEIEDATVGKRLQPRQDYFRHFQEQQQGFLVGLDNVINGATNIDPRLIGVSEFAKPNSKWTGFLQRRKDGDIYTEDAIGGLLEYIPQAEYKINIEPNIPILRGVIKELKESTIQSRNANSFIDELMQITNDLAGKSNKWDRNFADFFGDEKGRKVLNALSTVSNRMRKNAVMGNFNSMIAQFFNLPNVVGYAKNPIDIADGFKTSIQASMGNAEAKALLDKSMFLRERYIDRSFRQFNTGILDNAEKFFSWTMELGDKAIADGAWLTFYKQAIKNMDEASAILKADEMTRKSIGGRGIAEMPLSQKAKVTKLFAPFQVEVRNAVNVLEDLGRAKDIGGLVGVFATSYLLNEVLKATTGREVGFNPFGTVQDSIEDGSNVVAGLVGNTITNIPGGSYVASAGASALGLSEYQMQELFGQNDPSRFGTGNIALQTLAAPVGQAIKGQNIDPIKPLAATLPRFGGKQLERGIRGLQDMAVLPKEKINLTEGISAKKQDFPASLSQSGRLRFAIEPNVQNYLTAPTLGTWSTKEGKDYIENERQPLGEKQTSNVDSLYRLGIEPKMAETIIRGLSGLTKKEEKMQFINTMNLDKSTKKTLLEDILGYSTDNIKPEERIDFGIDKAGLTSDQRTTYKSSVAPLGIDDKTYARIVNEMDANGSGRVSHEEAQAILDSTNLTREQKYKMWNVIDARWVEKNNPYR
jgi:hypothetical protein